MFIFRIFSDRIHERVYITHSTTVQQQQRQQQQKTHLYAHRATDLWLWQLVCECFCAHLINGSATFSFKFCSAIMYWLPSMLFFHFAKWFASLHLTSTFPFSRVFLLLLLLLFLLLIHPNTQKHSLTQLIRLAFDARASFYLPSNSPINYNKQI